MLFRSHSVLPWRSGHLPSRCPMWLNWLLSWSAYLPYRLLQLDCHWLMALLFPRNLSQPSSLLCLPTSTQILPPDTNSGMHWPSLRHQSILPESLSDRMHLLLHSNRRLPGSDYYYQYPSHSTPHSLLYKLSLYCRLFLDTYRTHKQYTPGQRYYQSQLHDNPLTPWSYRSQYPMQFHYTIQCSL